MGDKEYYIEDGILKERDTGFLRDLLPWPGVDKKIGRLYSNLDGSKETRNRSGKNVCIAKDENYNGERKAELDGEKGYFKEDDFTGEYKFHPYRNEDGKNKSSMKHLSNDRKVLNKSSLSIKEPNPDLFDQIFINNTNLLAIIGAIIGLLYGFSIGSIGAAIVFCIIGGISGLFIGPVLGILLVLIWSFILEFRFIIIFILLVVFLIWLSNLDLFSAYNY